MAMSQRRVVNNAGKQPTSPCNQLPLKPTSRVRWVVQDTSKTETADKPVSVSITDTFDNRFWRGDHRALSLPNLADGHWTKSDDDEDAENGAQLPQPVATATDVDTVTSLLTSATSSATSSSQMTSNFNKRKTKRAASFAEHTIPVITSVSIACSIYLLLLTRSI